MKKIVALCIFVCAFVAISAFAQQNKVVVIPLNSKGVVGTVVTTAGGAAWLPHNSSPTTVKRYVSRINVSGDGIMVLGVSAPASIDGVAYGLESLEICVNVTSPGYLDRIQLYRTDSATAAPQILSDTTDRTADGCYTYPVGDTIGKGFGIALTLSGGGTVRMEGTTFTWKEASTLTPAAATARTITLEEESNNR